MKLGLENITSLLARIGEPHRAVPAVLVGGTNGKGSVVTYVASILRAAHCSVGTFYSPHLFRIQERIRVDGDEIPTPALDRILGRLREEHRTVPFTYFEGVTAAAALYFSERGVDTAVYEVGLGGRLDATRLVNAVVTIVTGISKDHTPHLGSTHRRILDEKLGIARSGVPLVANLGTRALVARARDRCAACDAPFVDVSAEVEISIERIEWRRMVCRVRTPIRDYGSIETEMIGAVQARNMATAVRAAEMFGEYHRSAGGRVSRRRGTSRAPETDAGGVKRTRFGPGAGYIGAETVREGVRRAFIPCRFQVLHGDPRIVLDVSHNEEGLLAVIDTLLRLSRPERNVLVFGVMAHKELGRFPRRAAVAFREIVCTPLRKGRSAGGNELAAVFRGAAAGGGSASVIVARGMASALAAARRAAGTGDTIVICGSHLAVEEAVGYL